MTDYLALFNKCFQTNEDRFNLSGISPEQFACLYKLFYDQKSHESKFLFVFNNEDDAENFINISQSFGKKTHYYPGLGADIYSTILPSENNLFQRFNVLSLLSNQPDLHIVTTLNALLLSVPDPEFFQHSKLKISTSDILPPDDLALKLVELGYTKSLTIEEQGTFSNRGEIFDIYPIGSRPFRLYYFDDMIEEIFEVDKDNLKTLRENAVESILIEKTPYSLLCDEHLNRFKENFPRPKNNQKELIEYRQDVFRRLNQNQFFEDYPLFLSLFLEKSSTLLDHVSGFQIIFFDFYKIEDSYLQLKQDLIAEYQQFCNESDYQIKPSPNQILNLEINLDDVVNLSVNSLDIQVHLDHNLQNTLQLNIKPFQRISQGKDYNEQVKYLIDFILTKITKNYKVFILYQRENSLEEIKYIFKTFLNSEIPGQIHFFQSSLSQGFEYQNEKLLFISESDFFHSKVAKSKKKKNSLDEDLFAEQLSTLQIGDYVIHKDHGLGKYLGVQTLSLNDSTSDYITLEYQDEDKVYVPVYRMNLLQKYSSNQSELTVANLKTKKFEQIKNRAKNSVKKLAFDLLELQAKRKLKESHSFSPPNHEFNEFSLSFPFVETEDQMRAIEDVIEDMQSSTPMDRLVCGDVGFGKTEVAMRAAFLAVLDGKQVCLLVPTTVLGLQHYHSFVERFKNFPVNIDYLSRFKSAKQSSEVIEKLKNGKIDILIGTHKLLSDKIDFKDLGLVIIDEEQRFGVGHKEKLKLLKESVDTLTLTATPIPRTLQLSFLGIKDLSLIKTPPPKRQSIKTYLIKDDKNTIKAAIEKELARGGQIFIVHNKVQDIEIFTSKIRSLAPNAKIVFAHGQLSPKELERRIEDFYNHKYDILVSTTIIESGIDIPNANTMIIDRADTYGLSQLHQLRGRIGRSEKKAYAYFLIPNDRKLSDIAAKRLRALQTYAEIGSGFSLASSDLEIRGSGDILGAEQSGHLASIGLELYMELLQEAIHNLKGEKIDQFRDIEIITSFNTLIPESYIPNSAQRIRYYKKLSNKKSLTEIEDTIEEITDQFGPLPGETRNLRLLLESRLRLQGFGITKIKTQSQSIILYFDQTQISSDPKLQDKILKFFMQRPKVYKINPDFSINCKFKDKITVETFADFAKYIAEQIHIC